MGYTLNSILKRNALITPELLVGLYSGVTDAQDTPWPNVTKVNTCLWLAVWELNR
jgi:hypothetical protein